MTKNNNPSRFPFFKPNDADVFAPGKGDVITNVSEDQYTVFAPGGQKTVDIENEQDGSGTVTTDTIVFAPGTGSVDVKSTAESTDINGNNTATASASVFAPGSQTGTYGVRVEVEAIVGGDGTGGNEDLNPSSAYAEGYLFAPGSQQGTRQDGVQLDVEANVTGDTDYSSVVAVGMLFAPGSQSGADDGIDFEVTTDAGDETGTTAASYGSIFAPGNQTGGTGRGIEIDVDAEDTQGDNLAFAELDLFAPGNGDTIRVDLDAGDTDDTESGEIVFSYFTPGGAELSESLDARGGLITETQESGLSGNWFGPSDAFVTFTDPLV